jgi:hypothetical protein
LPQHPLTHSIVHHDARSDRGHPKCGVVENQEGP